MVWAVKNGEKHPHDVFLSILKIIEEIPSSLKEGPLSPMSAEKALEIAVKAGILTSDGELTDDYKNEKE